MIALPSRPSFGAGEVISSAITIEPIPPAFTLTSTEFKDGETIPDRYTCRGTDVNPPLVITNIPKGTKTMALTVHDPDGLAGVWVHWVVFNIPPDTAGINEKVVPGTQALNDFGNFYYGGPCPPDRKLHHYIFTLYALNAYLDSVNEGATKDTLDKALAGKIISRAILTGVYQNVNWK
ncbi:MAG: YbhB/YbcL family Raf kinase inhibitor-like protein [Candidatus Omnitrophica bacterium]|nr:YbhB/YbcL family Raf kinase inhibitor-like protein [Candidatus Omnitrophota bacterium]